MNGSKMLKTILTYMLCFFMGALTLVLVVFIYYLSTIPELEIWHKVILENEFSQESEISTFEEYLTLESTLFEELDEKIIEPLPGENRSRVNRYTRGSLSDPGKWDQNWNRTYVNIPEKPVAGVLLLHGMSDSPYSLSSLGKSLYEQGHGIIGLRLPGHGTIPSGLLEVTWEDMADSVGLAVSYMLNRIGNKNLYIIGYSNGGALALYHVLQELNVQGRSHVAGIILISPAVGVAPVASLASWQGHLSRIPGLRKLAWNTIIPEYDPFKYGGFAVNAGDQVYRLTLEIGKQMTLCIQDNKLDLMPKVLAFQSAADATVSTPALVNQLFARLPERKHELVLFDINRAFDQESLIVYDPLKAIQEVLDKPGLTFTCSIITNETDELSKTVLEQRIPGMAEPVKKPLPYLWNDGQYSLSHVALPFSRQDRLYGSDQSEEKSVIHLGGLSLKGERNLIRVPASEMIRLRWNPFYGYLKERVIDFVE